MHFSFPHTCPIIDKAISDSKTDIGWLIDSIARELNPMFRDLEEHYTKWKEEVMEELSSPIVENFNIVREINGEMRDEAEKQIAEQVDLIAEQEHRIKELEDLVVELQEELEI